MALAGLTLSVSLTTSALNLHYLPAEFSVIKKKKIPFSINYPTGWSNHVWATLVNVWDLFWHQGVLPAVSFPDSLWKGEEDLGSWLHQSGVVFPCCWAERVKGGRVLFKYHRLLLFLLGFSRFSWVNVSSFAIYSMDHFQRIKMLGFVFYNIYQFHGGASHMLSWQNYISNKGTFLTSSTKFLWLISYWMLPP